MELSQAKIRKLRGTGRSQFIRDSRGLYLFIRAGTPGDKPTRAPWLPRTTH